jgi:hypothetical protein
MTSGGNLQRFDDMNLDSPDAIGQTIYVGNSENNSGLLKWFCDDVERMMNVDGSLGQRCKIRCMFCSRLSPKQHEIDRTEGTENIQVEE